MRKTFLAVASALLIGAGVAGATTSAQAQDQNIVQIAQGNKDLSTLVAAVTAAELAETLSGPGPFTVFAPTNAAFEKLPAGTVETLLKDPKGDLTKILTLHVISGAVDSKAAIAAAGTNVETLGGPVAVKLDGDKLMVGGATVVTTDIKASNGVIHVIDAVITAPAAAAPESSEEAMPTMVDTGDDGLAASSDRSPALLLLAGAAALVVAGSSTVLVRSRRRS
jgi:transforming growth factor-beta-induced protein